MVVAVFSTGWDVDVASTCSTGVDVDAAGLAQADRDMTIANNRDMILFMVPLFVGKTKGRTLGPPIYIGMSLRVFEKQSSSRRGDCHAAKERRLAMTWSISSTANTSRDAAVDPSQTFPSSSFRNQTSPASTRDGLAFKGDDVGTASIEEPACPRRAWGIKPTRWRTHDLHRGDDVHLRGPRRLHRAGVHQVSISNTQWRFRAQEHWE